MIKATAPGRCGLIGNPTDMYGGSVISCSTRERAYCALDDSPGRNEIRIEVSGEAQTIREPQDLTLRGDRLDAARAVLSALDVLLADTRPFSLAAGTEIPMQAGLAGSTALLASIVGCVLPHMGVRLSPYETAELVRKIEHDVLGIVCGFQDHYMAVFGGVNYMDFRGKSSAAPQDAEAPFATIESLESYIENLPIVLAHTGVKHHSGTVHKSLRERWLEGEAAVVDGYVEIAILARLGKKALLAHEWETLGALMNGNHAIQRDLGGSGESNEVLIKAALDGGALGAKLAGAGGGGTILALTLDPDRMAQTLSEAGAEAIIYPAPSRGLTVEITS